MVKRVFLRCIRRIGFIAAGLIILCAVTLAALRLMSPLVEENKNFFEQITSRILQHPVKIQKISVGWDGLEPQIHLSGVNIQSGDRSRSLLKIDQLHFELHLWQSLLHRQILPDQVNISGAEVSVKQQPDGQWKILGVGYISQSHTLSSGAKEFFYWLALQSNIAINNVGAELYDNQNHRLALQHFNLSVRNNDRSHSILGTGEMVSEKKSMPIYFSIIPTRLSDFQHFDADFTLEIPKLDASTWWTQEFSTRYLKPFVLDSGSLIAKITGKIRHDALQEIAGNVQGTGLNFKNTHSAQIALLQQLHFSFIWQALETGWRCSLHNLGWQKDKTESWLKQFNLQYQSNGSIPSYQVYLDKVGLATLKNLFYFSGWWNDSFALWNERLQPTGELRHVHIQYEELPNKPYYVIESDFLNVTAKAWESFPGATDMQGKVYLTPDSGILNLSAQKATIHYPYLFKEPLNDVRVDSKLTWLRKDTSDWVFQIPSLILDNNNLHFQGQLALNLPAKEKPALKLSGQFDATDVGKLKNLVPKNVISNNLQDWLSHAFSRGKIQDGTVEIDTALKKSFLHLKMQVINFDLLYADDWPMINDINGILTIDDKDMLIKSNHAFTVGNALSNIVVRIPDLADPTILVDGNGEGETQAGINFLRVSPLEIGKAVTAWSGTGNLALTLHLQKKLLPGVTDSEVSGKVQFKDGKLNIMPMLPAVTDITGEVNFQNNIVNSKLLLGKMLNEPVQAQIGTSFDAKKQAWLVFHLNGQLNSDKIAKMIPANLGANIQGQAPYQGILKVTSNDKGELKSDLILLSELRGLKIALPMPLAKDPNQSTFTKMHLFFDDKDNLNLLIKFKNDLSFAGQYHANKDNLVFLSGELRFGKGQAVLQNQPGLVINGYLPAWDWETWYPFIRPSLQYLNSNASASNFKLRALSLDTDKLTLFQHTFDKTYIHISPKNDSWKINIDNKVISGNIYAPKSESTPWKIELEKLDYVSDKNSSLAQWQHEINPAKLPAVIFSCQKCQYNQNNLGAVKLKMTRIPGGVNVDELFIQNLKYTLAVKGKWSCPQNNCETDLAGYLSTQKLGVFLEDWGITQSLNAGFGATAFSLKWPGSPLNPAWADMTGHMSFNYSDGRIVQLSSNTESKIGLGRLLNILSLQSLPQTLFGFTHLGVKGFHFSSLKGEMTINKGVGLTKDLELEGPVAWVKVNGGISFASKEYDLHMKVIPNFTSSLPVIIGLTSGPFAGALTWIADKLLASKIGAVAATEYQVKGSWQNPDIIRSETKKMGNTK